jgi:iron-siderophore transport system substrate-binding protein
MTFTRTHRAAALVAAAALALAACGSDSDASDSEPATDASPATEESAASADATAESADTTAEEPSSGETSAEMSAEAPSEITVTTYHGDETTVPYQPSTVVVLDFAALDTLDTLGLGDRVIGVPSATALPPHLAAYGDDTENVGSLFEPDFEAINALDPDLIIAGGRSQPVVGELAEIAPTIDVTFEWGTEPFWESLVTNTGVVGEIFGVQAETDAAVAELEQSAADVAEAAADAGTGLVILTSGGEVSAYGPDPAGRFDLVYHLLGVTPAAEQVAIDTHGDAISFEFLAETDPDMLFVLDRDAAIGAEGDSARAILDNDLVNGTSAALNDRIVYVDTAKWYLSFGGLSSVETLIAEVGSAVG